MWAQLGAMLTQLGAMLAYLEGYVGRSWGLCRPILRPMLAHVDPCGAKRSEKWEQQKNKVKRRIFWGSAAYVGAMLAHLGAMLAHLGGYVGPSWGLCWPILGLCWPILELCWPILGLCWPILGLCWPILRPMLAHLEAYVGPCWPILNHKIRKMGKSGKSTKHRKTRDFLAGPGGRRQGVQPLSPTERRETPSAMPRPGGPWPDFRADAHRRLRRITWPRCHRRVGLKAIEWGPAASEIYSLCFFEHIHGIMKLRFFSWSKWGRRVPESSCEGFSPRIAANFNFPLRVKAPLCKEFSV